MDDRPNLANGLDSKTFRCFYYLKSELVNFCRENGLSIFGSKLELTERVAYFLDTGKHLPLLSKYRKKKYRGEISETTIIEDNIACSENHRAFFKKFIGEKFSFNVQFQNWLKNNSGKTYSEAVDAYYEILEKKKNEKSVIDKQFEYNSYIRSFFEDNKGKSLKDAIKCWKYKKALLGDNRYEQSDLDVLKQ